MEDNLNLKLQELRKKNNLSQAEVAEHLHVSRQAISQWENGKASPDIENIKKICKLYHIIEFIKLRAFHLYLPQFFQHHFSCT